MIQLNKENPGKMILSFFAIFMKRMEIGLQSYSNMGSHCRLATWDVLANLFFSFLISVFIDIKWGGNLSIRELFGISKEVREIK